MSRMCSKCGIVPPRTPQSTVCRSCANLGSKAPVNPAAARAAAEYDAVHGNGGKGRVRPKLDSNLRMKASAEKLRGADT